MDLEIRLATTSDLKYIDHLQKKYAALQRLFNRKR